MPNLLAEKGDNISPMKAQISQPRVQQEREPGVWTERQQLVHYHLQPQTGNPEAFSGWLGSVTSVFPITALKQNPCKRLSREKKGYPFNGIELPWWLRC